MNKIDIVKTQIEIIKIKLAFFVSVIGSAYLLLVNDTDKITKIIDEKIAYFIYFILFLYGIIGIIINIYHLNDKYKELEEWKLQ